MNPEITEKERRVRRLLDEQKLDALVISTTANFAWLTCGGSNYVGIATELGAAAAVVTREAKYIVCDNIEAPRIMTEEVVGQGFELASYPWHEDGRTRAIRKITGGEVGADVPMDGARNVAALVDPLRWSLAPEEIERYKWIGARTGEMMTRVANELKPGMTEHEIAAMMAGEVVAFGGVTAVNLVAVDDRIEQYRHPLPTDKKLERLAMLVIGAKKWGLAVSASRLVHFGPIPPELRRKHDAVARVDAAFIAATVPSAVVGDIFRQGMAAYAAEGYPEEWRLHHQGGPTGYKGRDFKATPDSAQRVVENQAFAWNPSITGTKSEDTIIATPSGPEVISTSPAWPMTDTSIPRPRMIERG